MNIHLCVFTHEWSEQAPQALQIPPVSHSEIKLMKLIKTNVYIRFENIGALGGILLYTVIYFQFWQSPKLFPTW